MSATNKDVIFHIKNSKRLPRKYNINNNFGLADYFLPHPVEVTCRLRQHDVTKLQLISVSQKIGRRRYNHIPPETHRHTDGYRQAYNWTGEEMVSESYQRRGHVTQWWRLAWGCYDVMRAPPAAAAAAVQCWWLWRWWWLYMCVRELSPARSASYRRQKRYAARQHQSSTASVVKTARGIVLSEVRREGWGIWKWCLEVTSLVV